MKTKIWVGAIFALGLFFLWLILSRGILFLQQPQPEAKGIGAAFILLFGVGLWVMWREISFGLAAQRLASTLEAEGGLPVDDLPRTPAGRIVRAAADAQFETYSSAVEADDSDWRNWFRLSLAYDASGDRRRARAAVRRAITLERSTAR